MLEDGCSEFRLFGYRLLPIIFDESGTPRNVAIDHLSDFNLSEVLVAPDLSGYVSLGYDVVGLPPSLILVSAIHRFHATEWRSR